MTDTDDRRLVCFHGYAAAFERAYASGDWSQLEPFFTATASTELNGNRIDGRAAVLASFRSAVAMFDHRFDSRMHRLIEGPEVRDGVVRIKAAVRYERAGLDPLELVGEEWFHFEGDRIARHVDHLLNGVEVMTYLARHGDELRPVVMP